MIFIALGALGATLTAALGASPEWAMLPMSAGLLVAAVLVPFPTADYVLAFLVGATVPALPPSDLPNMPLGIPVLVVALVRLARAEVSVSRAAIVALAGFWALLAIGVLVSDWPSVSFWLRPTAIVGVAALASAVGLVVGADRERTLRWVLGFCVLACLVASTALVFYAAQFVVSIQPLVSWLAAAQGYARGEAAAAFFEAINNWVIWSPTGGIVRAVSIFIPAPHGVGAILGLVVPLLASLVLVDHPAIRRHRGLWWLVLIVATAALVLTLSRATWLAAAVATIVAVASMLAFLRRPDVVRRALVMAGTATVVVALAGATVVAAGQSAAGVGDRLTEASEDESVTDRVESGQEAIAAVIRDPLRGYGLGGWSASAPGRIGASYVHNLYLEYARALGVSGLLWAIAIPGIFVATGLVALRRTYRERFLGLALVTIGSFVAVHFMFDDSFLVPQYAWLLAWMLGAAISLVASLPRSTAQDH